MWKATDVEPAFVDKPFAPRVGFCFNEAPRHDRDEHKPKRGVEFFAKVVVLFPKKLAR